MACAPQQQRGAVDARPAPAAQSQNLAIAIYAEPGTLAQKPLGAGPGTSFRSTVRAFNATLGIVDGEGLPRPYLAEVLPKLDTESWVVSPEGRMETRYRLRANLTWHDGAPMTAEDFVFAWQVYSSPRVGIATRTPQTLITDVSAPDPLTVLILWRAPYPEASTLAGEDFPPLPRHLLQATFQEDPSALESQSFWTRDYVGSGPYRLTRWEPGAFIEGDAFAGHSLGKPKIDQIRISFISDSNAVLAAVLAGDVQMATDIAIKFDQALILQRDWVPQRKGTVILRPGSYHGAYFQLRPDTATPRALLDLRVRRALAHSLNRQDINDAIFDGQGIMTEVPNIPPASAYRAEADRLAVKYPYDVRATETLLTDAGYRKGNDGIFVHPTDGPLRIELKTLVSSERQKEQEILITNWRAAGFDFSAALLAAAQSTDSELRATFPGMFTFTQGPGEYAFAHDFSSGAIGTPDKRWIGNNRGAWSNEEFDRLSAAFSGAVAPADRIRYIAEMVKVHTENVPNIPISFGVGSEAFVSGLRGPRQVAPETLIPWNIHEWELS